MMRWEVRECGSTSFLCLSCTLWSNTLIFSCWGDHKVGPLDSIAYLRHITLRYSVRREKLTRRHSSWNVNLILPWGCCWIWRFTHRFVSTWMAPQMSSLHECQCWSPSSLSLTWHQCYNHLMRIIWVKVLCSYWHVGSVVYVTRGSAFWIDWLITAKSNKK